MTINGLMSIMYNVFECLVCFNEGCKSLDLSDPCFPAIIMICWTWKSRVSYGKMLNTEVKSECLTFLSCGAGQGLTRLQKYSTLSDKDRQSCILYIV